MTPGRPLVAIAAVGRNRALGKDNRLPWRIPEDFAFFKATTMGHVLVMGRRTYESIGRPLPGRTTVVLSRSGFSAPGITVVGGWEGLRDIEPGRTLFLAGGAQLYAEALPRCSELLLTHVDLEPEADAFFPDWTKWFDSGELVRQGPGFVIRRHLPLRHETCAPSS
jgi:dihydrofolate reductase